MSRALEGRGGQFAHYKPVDYLWRHIGVVASRTMQFPLASLIVAGDFNGTFGPSKSSYQDMVERSSAAGLVRGVEGPPPPTFMVQTTPSSSIDHILLSERSPFSLCGIEADYDSASVSDHAVLTGYFELNDPSLADLPRRPPKVTYKELNKELSP